MLKCTCSCFDLRKGYIKDATWISPPSAFLVFYMYKSDYLYTRNEISLTQVPMIDHSILFIHKIRANRPCLNKTGVPTDTGRTAFWANSVRGEKNLWTNGLPFKNSWDYNHTFNLLSNRELAIKHNS